jgi:hypothetical protein
VTPALPSPDVVSCSVAINFAHSATLCIYNMHTSPCRPNRVSLLKQFRDNPASFYRHARYPCANLLLTTTCCAVYHVGPDGWRKVWSGDTTEMFYEYYPVQQVKK